MSGGQKTLQIEQQAPKGTALEDLVGRVGAEGGPKGVHSNLNETLGPPDFLVGRGVCAWCGPAPQQGPTAQVQATVPVRPLQLTQSSFSRMG